MNVELLKTVLIVALGGGILATNLVQKIKEGFSIENKKVVIISNFAISMVIGTLFALSFSELSIINALWVGLITFIGADLIYKAFEDKIFNSISTIKAKNVEEDAEEIVFTEK